VQIAWIEVRPRVGAPPHRDITLAVPRKYATRVSLQQQLRGKATAHGDQPLLVIVFRIRKPLIGCLIEEDR
jgi:hypothetical protein